MSTLIVPPSVPVPAKSAPDLAVSGMSVPSERASSGSRLWQCHGTELESRQASLLLAAHSNEEEADRYAESAAVRPELLA